MAILFAATVQVMNVALIWKVGDEEVWLWKILLGLVALVIQVVVFAILAGDMENAEVVSQEEWDEFQKSILEADEDDEPEDSVVEK